MNEGDVSDGFAKGVVERFGTFLWVNVNARSSDRKPVGSRSKVTNYNLGYYFLFLEFVQKDTRTSEGPIT